MHQKRNSLAQGLIALLSVLSLGTSFFVTSTLTYAVKPSSYNVAIYVTRPSNSTVGSVRYRDADNPALGNGCLSIPNQTDQPAPNGSGTYLMGTYPNLDNIAIELFPDGNCSAEGFPNPDNEVVKQAYRLGRSLGFRSRIYTTPSQA
jgi:hypothetical protein